jgi:photosystem II stability/assembly factor-like uncharacterized protein
MALAVLAAAAIAGGCGKGVTKPFILPPLSRVVIAQGGDTTVVTDTLKVGFALQFTAVAFDTGGAPVPAAPLAWSSSQPAIFGVTASGRATGLGEGRGLIVVTVGGKSDSVSLLVLPGATGWFAQVSSSTGKLNGVYFDPDGRHGWAVGDGGEILATTDAGENWAHQASSTLFNLNSVWFTDADSGWAVGNSGMAVHTTDGGANWTPMPTGASENLMDVVFAYPDTGWAVGSAGAILTTFNWGATWTKQNPTTFTLHSVSFAGTRRGWAVGDNGTILGTTDRGLTWSIEPPVTSQSLRGVWRRSELVAFAAGQQGVVPRTVNVAGLPVWELQNTGASNQLEGVFYPTDAIGFAVGLNASALVLRTDDAGVTWSPQTVPVPTTLRDVYFVDELRGWAVGDNGRIVHTGSGGNP